MPITNQVASRSGVSRALIVPALVALALVGGIALAEAPARAQDESFQVVAHPSVSAPDISQQALRQIFLKRKTRWDDGSRILPVDQEFDRPVRSSFSEDVLGRSADAMQTYWQAQIFSGRALPPTVLDDDEDVLNYVSSTIGAVGYVSAEARVPSGVKVLELVEQ